MKNLKKIKKKNNWVKDIKLSSMGWEMALPIFSGTVIGFQIDRHSDTNNFFTLSLLFLGIITGYINLYRHIELELLRTKSAKLKKQKDNPSS